MKKLFVALLVSAFSAGLLRAGELDSKLGKMAQKFADTYSSRPGAVVPAPTAIFPLQTDENLAKRRVNFAATEVFTSQMLKSGKFKIVERTDLEKVLQEQRLSLSGAIETDKAADVGKLVGAKLLAMGSINRLGGSYQISIRLVNAETSEVITSEYAEVPVKTFEEETKLYLPYVPEKEAVGIFAMYLLNPVNLTLTSLLSTTPVKYTYANPNTNTNQAVSYYTGWNNYAPSLDGGSIFGFGVKYSPWSWLVIDLGMTPALSQTQDIYLAQVNITDSGSGRPDTPEGQQSNLTYTQSSFQLGLSGIYNVSKKVRLLFGAGATQYTITNKITGNLAIRQPFYYSGGDPYYLELNRTVNQDGKTVTPTVSQDSRLPQDTNMTFTFEDNMLVPYGKIGLEWKPQERLGVSLLCTMPFGSLDQTFTMVTVADFVDRFNNTTVLGNKTSKLYEIKDNELPEISLAVSLYF